MTVAEPMLQVRARGAAAAGLVGAGSYYARNIWWDKMMRFDPPTRWRRAMRRDRFLVIGVAERQIAPRFRPREAPTHANRPLFAVHAGPELTVRPTFELQIPDMVRIEVDHDVFTSF